MFFYKIEYPISEKIDDVLNWLEKDLQKPIERIEGDKVRATFESKRTGNTIEVRHNLYDVLTGEHFGGDVSFLFELEKVADSKSIIIGKYAVENIHIEKLFYLYLARLGGVFHADFKESVTARLAEIQAQIEKEQGGRMGFTEWRTIEGTGIKMRSYGIIPNDMLTIDAAQAAEPPIGTGKAEDQELKYEAILEQANFEDTTGWDMTLIQMWNDGHSCVEVARSVGVGKARVQNRKSEIRRMLGKKNGFIVLPKDKDRKAQMVKSRYTA